MDLGLAGRVAFTADGLEAAFEQSFACKHL